jgi:pyrimidine deaminase RibD-like protein
VPGGGLLVPREDGRRRGRLDLGVVEDDALLLAAVDVAERVDEPLAVGEQVGCGVVVERVARELVAALDREHVGDAHAEREARDEQDAVRPAPAVGREVHATTGRRPTCRRSPRGTPPRR